MVDALVSLVAGGGGLVLSQLDVAVFVDSPGEILPSLRMVCGGGMAGRMG